MEISILHLGGIFHFKQSETGARENGQDICLVTVSVRA